MHPELEEVGKPVTFCGRQKELKEILRLWGIAASGSGKLVVLEGSRGFGKTRLAKQASIELISERERQGKRNPGVLWVSCKEFEQDARGALIAGLQRFIEELKVSDSFLAEKVLASIGEKAFLNWLLGSDFASCNESYTLENQQEAFRKLCVQVIDALCQFCAGFCLMIDDAHFLDEGSEGILNELKNSLSRLPLFVLLVFDRKNLLEQKKVLFSVRSHLDAKLSLEGMCFEDSREFVLSLLGPTQVQEPVVKWLFLRSKGCPSLLRRMILSSFSTGKTDLGTLSDSTPAESFESIFGAGGTEGLEFYKRRLGLMPQHVLGLVRVCAVVGRQIPLELLAKAVQQPSGDLSVILKSAALFDVFDFDGRTVYFSDEDFREVALAQIPVSEREEINLLLANAIESEEPKSQMMVLQLARYFSCGKSAGNEERICKWNLEAGLVARKSFRYTEAIEFFVSLVRVGEPIRDERLFLACLQIAELSIYLGQVSQARDWLQKAESISRAGSIEPATQAFISYLRGYSYTTEYSMNLAEGELVEALRVLNLEVPVSSVRLVFGFFGYLLRGYFGYLYHSKWKLEARSEKGSRNETLLRERVLVCNILSIYFNCLINSGKNLRAMWVTAFAFWNSNVLKNHPDRVMNLNICAITFADLGFTRLSDYFLKVSQSVAEGSGRKDKIATSKGTRALCSLFLGKSKVVFDHATEGLSWCEKYAGAREFNIVKMGYSYLLSIYGRHEESARFCLDQLEMAQVSSSLGVCQVFIARTFSQLVILGRMEEASELVDARREYLESLKTPSAYANDDAAQIIADCEVGQVSRDTELRISRLEANPMAHHPSIQSGLIAIGYIRLEQYRRAGIEEKRSMQSHLLTAISRSIRPKKASQASHFQCHYWILRAGMAVAEGHPRIARVFLWFAQRHVRMSASSWGEWALLVERARLARLLRREEDTKRYAQEAIEISTDLGWLTRADAVERWLNPKEGETASPASRAAA